MAFYSKSMIPLIESKYNTFTQSEREIADFFIKNTNETDFSAQTMSEKIFVSKASLSRFAKKCGFQGYREFIYHYKETMSSEKKKEPKSSKTVFETYHELLNKAYNLIDETQINKLVDLLYEKKRAIIFGLGSNGFAAREMESRFMRIGLDIDSLDQPDRIKMQAPFLDSNYVIIGLSLSGESKEVLYLLKEAKEKGAATVLITSNDKEYYQSFCDEVVIVASLSYMSSGDTISPQFPMLLAIDILYHEYVARDKDEKNALHSKSIEALAGKGKEELFYER